MKLNKTLKSAIFLAAMLGFAFSTVNAATGQAFTDQDAAVFKDSSKEKGVGSRVRDWLLGGTAALAISHVILAKYLGKGITDLNGIYGDTAAGIKLHQIWTRIKEWKAAKRASFVGWLWRRGGDDDVPVEDGATVLQRAGEALKGGAQVAGAKGVELAKAAGAKGAEVAGKAFDKGKEFVQDPDVRENVKKAATTLLWYDPRRLWRWVFSNGEKQPVEA